MKWIVGLDLLGRCAGALRFATWFRATSRAADGEHFVAVHVLEEQHLLVVLRYRHLQEVLDGARGAARSFLAKEGASGSIGELEIVQGAAVDEALEAARAKHRADGILIGRAAGRGSHSVVRLGRVARRLVRSAVAPVMVVPPDLDAQGLGEGPVVALTNLEADSVDACRFAASIAERLGRGLALLHVVPAPEEYGAPFLPFVPLEDVRREHREQAEKDFAEWVAAQGLRAQIRSVVEGRIVESALAFAEQQRSPLLVSGARRASVLERTLVASTGTELAAWARCRSPSCHRAPEDQSRNTQVRTTNSGMRMVTLYAR